MGAVFGGVMSFFDAVVGTLLVFAVGVLVLGLANKVWVYAATPAPLRIPTTPAPLTRLGAAGRLAREVLLFESLFRADKVLWALSALFHAGLALVLLRHLRYVLNPVPWPIEAIQPLGVLGAGAMMVGLAGLLARRLFLPSVRMITRATDLAVLVLLLAIGATGLVMTLAAPADIMGLKIFLAGLWRFAPAPLPDDPVLVLHLVLAAVLMAVAPFSKLLHMAGVFFSPTRAQCDNARERRHLVSWARPLDDLRPR